jgi:hypothetical protein
LAPPHVNLECAFEITKLGWTCGQKAILGRVHGGQTFTLAVSDTTLVVKLDDAETCVVRRITTTMPVHNIQTNQTWTALQFLGECQPSPGTNPVCMIRCDPL